MTCACVDRDAITSVIIRYAACLDQRDWSGLEDVLVEGARATYGGRLVAGRDAIIEMTRGFLGGCGPSQHLLGQHTVRVEGELATSETEVRVIHQGAGERAHLVPYESIGTYHDRLVRGPGGWRVAERRFDVRIEMGDRAVLAPAPR